MCWKRVHVYLILTLQPSRGQLVTRSCCSSDTHSMAPKHNPTPAPMSQPVPERVSQYQEQGASMWLAGTFDPNTQPVPLERVVEVIDFQDEEIEVTRIIIPEMRFHQGVSVRSSEVSRHKCRCPRYSYLHYHCGHCTHSNREPLRVAGHLTEEHLRQPGIAQQAPPTRIFQWMESPKGTHQRSEWLPSSEFKCLKLRDEEELQRTLGSTRRQRRCVWKLWGGAMRDLCSFPGVYPINIRRYVNLQQLHVFERIGRLYTCCGFSVRPSLHNGRCSLAPDTSKRRLV